MTCTQGGALGDPQTDIELPISQHTVARGSVGINFIHIPHGVHGYSQTVIYNIARFNIDILADVTINLGHNTARGHKLCMKIRRFTL